MNSLFFDFTLVKKQMNYVNSDINGNSKVTSQ